MIGVLRDGNGILKKIICAVDGDSVFSDHVFCVEVIWRLYDFRVMCSLWSYF